MVSNSIEFNYSVAIIFKAFLDTILLTVESLEVTEDCLGFSIQFSLQSNHSKWQINVWLLVSNIILNYLSVRVFLWRETEQKCIENIIFTIKLALMKFHCYYVYILLWSDGSYYTGVTNNINLRFEQHSSGLNPSAYTFSRRPIQLVFYTEFNDINFAIQKEKQFKKWSKMKKEALINGEFENLPNLSKKKFGWGFSIQFSLQSNHSKWQKSV